jgi:hypothetical protein
MPSRSANTQRSHFSRNIFLQQSSAGNVQQPPRGVGQDKPHPSRERIASAQPGSGKKDMRSHDMNSNTPRSQKRSTPQRKTVQLIVWVHPFVKAEIQRTAKREGLSVSKVGAAFLEQATRQDIHSQYNSLIQPMIEQTVRKELRSFGNRLVFFLMRIAFASEQARILITNILDRILRREGVPESIFTNLVAQSNKMAQRNIIKKTPQLTSLLEEWEEIATKIRQEDDKKNNE